MYYKIEDIKPSQIEKNTDHNKFLETLRDLQVGQSFLVPLTNKSARTGIISMAKRLLDRDFVTRTEKEGLRISRIR